MKHLTALLLSLSLLTQTLPAQTQTQAKPRCLVLRDGYVTEYAWGKYAEGAYPAHHPGQDFTARGLLRYKERFVDWLPDYQVQVINLEEHQGALTLAGIDLVILDDLRQLIADPYEPALVEYVRAGGGLLVYGGFWGLGGCAKSEFSVNQVVSSYQKSPLGAILPVTITATPDYHLADEQSVPKAAEDSFRAVITPNWRVFGLHECEARGQVLLTLGEKPLVVAGPFGRGQVVVYTGDDLAWVRAGKQPSLNATVGPLWRRLAQVARGQEPTAPAVTAPPRVVPKPASYAHPEQPMNFLWAGGRINRELTQAWINDLRSHSCNLFDDAPAELGRSGIVGWRGVAGVPIMTQQAARDQSTWRVDAAGKPVRPGNNSYPCVNNPTALKYLDEYAARSAKSVADEEWTVYGHMGDETEFEPCYCEHCQKLFKQQCGYDMPGQQADFSPAYLDKWIDMMFFHDRSVGAMYARAAKVAKEQNPRLKMFASLPQTAGTTKGDNQYHSQAGFDLLWDHTYPHNMILRVGMTSSLMEETAALQGRPYQPVFNLLQGFDQYDRAPRMPQPEYMREMAWQAVAHGVDSVGWFVYNYTWWNMPGTAAWDEAGRLARQVLEPLTPTLYQMTNTRQPVGLMYCYSQEAVDGLKWRTWPESEPWKGMIRWWTQHATQEAYEVLKYSQTPFNMISEFRLSEGAELPFKAIIIPYAEHLHPQTAARLAAFIKDGGKVYTGANSTLELTGVIKLPFSFDAQFNTWWPKDRKEEWGQRRSRQFIVSTTLAKAEALKPILGRFPSLVRTDDPEVVWSVREAGAAKYIFLINDHQSNPATPEFRRRRLIGNHFMLLSMEFPPARTNVTIAGPGCLYQLLNPEVKAPINFQDQTKVALNLDGGDGTVLLLTPEPITGLKLLAPPARTEKGIRLQAELLGSAGRLAAGIPIRIELQAGSVKQVVYDTTKAGVLEWTAPLLQAFPAGPIQVTLTDLAGQNSCTASVE